MLSTQKSGTFCEVEKIHGGRNLLQRMVALGIVPGCKLEVSSSGLGGAMVIVIGNTKLAIGRGVASKIEVKQI